MSLLDQAISVVAEAPPEALPAALLQEVRQRLGAHSGELMAMLEERAAESLGLSAQQFIQRLGLLIHGPLALEHRQRGVHRFWGVGMRSSRH